MLCFTFVCVYGNHYDWWDSQEISFATLLSLACLAINLWRATFLHHPYISFKALTNGNVVRATLVYLVFFTLLATEHVFEHTYGSAILGFDHNNIIDLNWYVLAGIVAGTGFTYLTFALCKWRYKTMTAIGFSLTAGYLAWFYFLADFGVEKESLFIPLFMRGAASVIISIVYLTSIVQSGLHFFVFPQALTVNGFTGAVMGATLGLALIGEFLRHVMAKNVSLMSMSLTHANPVTSVMATGELNGMVQAQALAVSVKEIYGWLLIAALLIVALILISYGPLRPNAIFPKWKTIKRVLRHLIRQEKREQANTQSVP